MNGKQNSGFTIVELLIVVVIIGILATIAIVAYGGITQRANESAINLSLSQASKKVLVYATEYGDVLPTNLLAAGVVDDPSTTYQYTRNTASSPNNFCITATRGSFVSHIATGGVPVEGPCVGHTGTVPTTLADSGSCPSGYIVVPGASLYGTRAFCVMKFEAKNVSGVATSQASGTPWVSIDQPTAITQSAAACSGCHLINEAEWLTIAQNVMSVASNWTSGTVGTGSIYIGHTDNSPGASLAGSIDTDGYSGTGNSAVSNQRRTLTLANGSVIWDFSGNVWDWTSGVIGYGQPGFAGYAFRQWNAIVATGSTSPNLSPVYANASAASWTSTNGIGQVYSNSSETLTRSVLRGGYIDDISYGGIYRATLQYPSSTSSSLVGFRVAK